ncbi:PhzF family phenazine biosynthesis protein [Bordetella petrii]|nr:PhzF family phenazine biosynthesis protein [Bordetella petrii]
MHVPAARRPPRPPAPGQAILIRVFVDPAAGARGGNPVPLVLDARGMASQAMQALAADYGHESAFILPPADPASGHDWRFRFFVPGHEMEMCGHATVGTLWALRQWGCWRRAAARIETASGSVDGIWDEAGQRAWISQPPAQLAPLPAAALADIARVLRIDPATPGLQAVNACTSRVKTLVRLPGAAALDSLAPDFSAVPALCDALESTGLYPYALAEGHACARQFPKSSGYPEDAATGIAAAALWGYLHQTGRIDPRQPCTIRQGIAMGSPSAIELRARDDAPGCWLSGAVQWQD